MRMYMDVDADIDVVMRKSIHVNARMDMRRVHSSGSLEMNKIPFVYIAGAIAMRLRGRPTATVAAISALAGVLRGQLTGSCFFTWGATFELLYPTDWFAASSICAEYTTLVPLSTVNTITITIDETITQTITQTTTTSLITAVGGLATAGLGGTFVFGNCMLYYTSGGQSIYESAWLGPTYQVSVGPNGLETNQCTAYTSLNQVTPTAVLENCNVQLPALCAYTALAQTTVTVTQPTVVTVTTGQPPFTFTSRTTTTTTITTDYATTTTTTRTEVSLTSTSTITVPVTSFTTSETVTPTVTDTIATTFTFLQTFYTTAVVNGTRTETVVSTVTAFTTTVSFRTTETFCSARTPLDE